MFRVTDAISPDATPAFPVKVGFGLFVGEAMGISVTAGGVISIVKIDVALLPILPASSTCSACAVYVPSSRGATDALHLVPLDGTTTSRTGIPKVLSPA